jgi:hypothetical protein
VGQHANRLSAKAHETQEPATVQEEPKSSNADHDEGVFAAVQSPSASENEERGSHERMYAYLSACMMILTFVDSTIDTSAMSDAAESMPNDDIQAAGTRKSTASQDERHVHFSDTPSPGIFTIVVPLVASC